MKEFRNKGLKVALAVLLLVIVGVFVWLREDTNLFGDEMSIIDSWGADYAASWKVYNGSHYGWGRGFSTPFSFQFPPDWRIEDNGDFEKWMIVKVASPGSDPVRVYFYVSEQGYKDEFQFLRDKSVEENKIVLNGSVGTHFIEEFGINKCKWNYYLLSDDKHRFFEVKFATCSDEPWGGGEVLQDSLNIANTFKIFPKKDEM